MNKIIDKPDFIAIEDFCSMKDSVKRMRTQAINWKKIFVKVTSDK